MSEVPVDQIPVGRIRVVGAGISGLLTAYFLVKQGCEVEIFEQDSNVGGKLRSRRDKLGLVESAANAILANQLVEDVAKDLGVQLISKKPEARKRFILKNRIPRRWPIGFKSTLRLIWFFLRLKLGFGSLQPRSYETLLEWSERELGSETTKYLIDPACQGIFGVTSKDLSATLIFEYFYLKSKSLKGKLRGSVAPMYGMAAWTDGLKLYLQQKGVSFHFAQDGIKNRNPQQPIVIATDIGAASEALKTLNDPRGEALAQVPMVDLVSVTAFFKTPLVAGFGVLFPRDEAVPLGVLFNSCIFDERSVAGVNSETWIFGDKTPAQASSDSDAALIGAITHVRRELWGQSESALDYKVSRWEKALPLYGVELERVLESLELERDNVYLMGNYLSEIGLNRIFSKAKAIATLVAGSRS